MKDIDKLEDALNLIQNSIPIPMSGQWVVINGQCCTHYDPEVVALYSSILKFRRFVGLVTKDIK